MAMPLHHREYATTTRLPFPSWHRVDQQEHACKYGRFRRSSSLFRSTREQRAWVRVRVLAWDLCRSLLPRALHSTVTCHHYDSLVSFLLLLKCRIGSLRRIPGRVRMLDRKQEFRYTVYMYMQGRIQGVQGLQPPTPMQPMEAL
jgi:hypothetical protein